MKISMESTYPQIAPIQSAAHVRWMIRRDMLEVMTIENLSYERPWSEEDFLDVLRQRNVIGLVAEHGEKVVGLMVYELMKPRIELANIAVHPSWRRTGIAAKMIARMVNTLNPVRRNRISANVRETNLAAQLFFKAQGFRAVKVKRGFYDDTHEDAIRMVYRLGDHL